MPLYRKKPVVIEAERLTLENMNRAFNFITCSHYANGTRENPSIRIQTLEGQMTASLGDWIIRGVNGEFYPCKDDIFQKTYDLAEPPPVEYCDICPHAVHLHYPDGSCGCGMDCANERNARASA